MLVIVNAAEVIFVPGTIARRGCPPATYQRRALIDQLAVAANQRHVFCLIVGEQPVSGFALRELGFCRFTRGDISRDDKESADFAALCLVYGGYVTFDPYDVFVFAQVPKFSTNALACFDGLSKRFSSRFMVNTVCSMCSSSAQRLPRNNMRSGISFKYIHHLKQLTNDRALAAALNEAQRGFDFRPHRTWWEMSFRLQAA